MDALAQAQVAVFPVDVRGVVLNPEGALTEARPNGGAANMSDPNASNAPDQNGLSNPTNNPVLAGMQTSGDGGSLSRIYANEEAVAQATGGRAFYSRNDVAEALIEATEEGGNYYTLSYAPQSPLDDDKCHAISVKLGQASYQLAYRHSYGHSPMVSVPADEKQALSEKL